MDGCSSFCELTLAIRELAGLKTETLNRTLFSRIESSIDPGGVDVKGIPLRHHQHHLSLSENTTGSISHCTLRLLQH